VFVVTLSEHEDLDPLDEPPVELLLLPLLEPLLEDEGGGAPHADELTVTPVAALKFVLSVE
jgi:hypothetical protein